MDNSIKNWLEYRDKIGRQVTPFQPYVYQLDQTINLPANQSAASKVTLDRNHPIYIYKTAFIMSGDFANVITVRIQDNYNNDWFFRTTRLIALTDYSDWWHVNQALWLPKIGLVVYDGDIQVTLTNTAGVGCTCDVIFEGLMFREQQVPGKPEMKQV